MWQPTIYILGSPEIFQSALEGLQAVFSPISSDPNAWAGGGTGAFAIGTVIKLAFMVGLLVIAGRGIMTQKYEWHHLAVGFLVYVALFIPTTTVVVQDLYTGTSFAVNGIPIGVAYPAGFSSEVSYYLMTTVDTVNQPASGAAPPISMSSSGFEGPLMTVMALRGLTANTDNYDPDMVHTLLDFVKNCDASSPNFDVSQDIKHQPDIMQKLLSSFNPNPSSTVVFDTQHPWGSASALGVPCSVAAADISDEWSTFTSGTSGPASVTLSAVDGIPQSVDIYPLSSILASHTAQAGMANPNTQGSGSALSNVENSLNTLMPSCSGSGASTVCQAGTQAINFMKNQISGCLGTAGYQFERQTGTATPTVALPAFCLDMSNGLATQQEKNAGMASLFEANVVPLMTILQFLFFALSPLVALMVAFMGSSGNHGVYAKYMLFGIWTESFLPVAALINDYSQFQVQNVLTANTNGITGVAVSRMSDYVNIGSVFSHVQLALSSANMMLVAVPILTFSILTGSYYAMTKLGGMISGENVMTPEGTAQVQPPKYNEAPPGYDVASTGQGSLMLSGVGLATAPSFALASALSSSASAATSDAFTMTRGFTNAMTNSNQVLASAINSYQTSQGFDSSTGTSLKDDQSAIQKKQADIALLDSQTHGAASTAAAQGAAGVGLNVPIGEWGKKFTKDQLAKFNADMQEAYKYGQDISQSQSHALSTLQDVKGSNKALSSQTASYQDSLTAQKTSADQVAAASQQAYNLTQAASQAQNSSFGQSVSAQAGAERVLAMHGQGAPAAVAGFMNQLRQLDPQAWSAGMAAEQQSHLTGLAGEMVAASTGAQYASMNANPFVAGAASVAYGNLLGMKFKQQAPSQMSSVSSVVSNGAKETGAATQSVPESPGPVNDMGQYIPSGSLGSSMVDAANQRVNASPAAVSAAAKPLVAQWQSFQALNNVQQGGAYAFMGVYGSHNKAEQTQYADSLRQIGAMPTANAQERNARSEAMVSLAQKYGVPQSSMSQVAAFGSSGTQQQFDKVAANAQAQKLPLDTKHTKSNAASAAFSFLSSPIVDAGIVSGGIIGADKVIDYFASKFDDAKTWEGGVGGDTSPGGAAASAENAAASSPVPTAPSENLLPSSSATTPSSTVPSENLFTTGANGMADDGEQILGDLNAAHNVIGQALEPFEPEIAAASEDTGGMVP